MLRLGIACLLLLALRGLPAQETVFYKCTDAKGNVSMQNGTPCAAGMKQEIKRVREVRTVPVPDRKPAVQAAPTAPVYGEFVLVSGPNMKRNPSPEAAGLPPPPPLFQCKTWEGNDYLGDIDNPPARCMPLQVTGIDGSLAMGAGEACEMKPDQCSAVPAETLCEGWLRRLDEADFKRKYAGNEDQSERDATFSTIDAKVKASHCSPVAPEAGPATPGSTDQKP